MLLSAGLFCFSFAFASSGALDCCIPDCCEVPCCTISLNETEDKSNISEVQIVLTDLELA